MPQGFEFLTPPGPLSVLTLMINLIIGGSLSFILAWHFRRFGKTMSNRNALSHVFPLIVLTTILVISIVKASLALSLGLVGALSIVRFRTPIKEPEELAYLFLAIGIGLGLGADQRLPTLSAALLIMALLAGKAWINRSKRQPNLFLNIDLQGGSHNGTLNDLTELLRNSTQAADVRRLDVRNGQYQATYSIQCRDEEQMRTLMNRLQTDYPDAAITFIDQNASVMA